MSRSAWTGVAAGLCAACGAAEPLVEGPPDPAWTEAELRAEVGRVLDRMDPASRRAGDATVAKSLALDEDLYPAWDEDGRRLLLEDTVVAADEALGCPTRGLLAGLWAPTEGRTGTVTAGVYAGADEPDTLAEGSYQDAADGPGDSLLVWQDGAGGLGELEGSHDEPDPQTVAAYRGAWVELESGERYGQAAGVWHPFRNQPGGLLLGTWVNCAEVDDGR